MHKQLRIIILYIFIILTLNGCVLAAVAVGTAVVAGGTIYYINGNYIIEIPRDMRDVYNATIKTIQSDNQYLLSNQTYTDESAQVDASLGTDNISISLTSIKNRSTEIKIRVGALGNEQKSADLANLITKNLT